MQAMPAYRVIGGFHPNCYHCLTAKLYQGQRQRLCKVNCESYHSHVHQCRPSNRYGRIGIRWINLLSKYDRRNLFRSLIASSPRVSLTSIYSGMCKFLHPKCARDVVIYECPSFYDAHSGAYVNNCSPWFYLDVIAYPRPKPSHGLD